MPRLGLLRSKGLCYSSGDRAATAGGGHRRPRRPGYSVGAPRSRHVGRSRRRSEKARGATPTHEAATAGSRSNFGRAEACAKPRSNHGARHQGEPQRHVATLRALQQRPRWHSRPPARRPRALAEPARLTCCSRHRGASGSWENAEAGLTISERGGWNTETFGITRFLGGPLPVQSCSELPCCVAFRED